MGWVKKVSSPFFVFLSVFLLYSLTQNQIFSFDAITHAIAAESNEPERWFHGNHPLYPFLGVMWYRIEVLLVHYQGLSIYSLARFNSLLMASAMTLIFLNLRVFLSLKEALVAVFFLASTYSCWFYAVDASTVGTSVVFYAAVIFYLIRIDHKNELRMKDVAMLSCHSSFMVLMHAIALFHVVPVFLFLYQKGKKQALQYLCLTGILISLVYLSSYFFFVHPRMPIGFISWAIGYAAFHGLENSLNTSFWSFSFYEILKSFFTGWQQTFIFSTHASSLFCRYFSILFVTLLGIILSLFFISIPRLLREKRELVLTLLVWGGLNHLFLLFWSPGHTGFRLHVLIPWFVALSIAFPYKKIFFWLFFTLGLILFWTNFNYTFYPSSFIQNNLAYQKLWMIRTFMQPGDYFLCAKAGAVPNIETYRPYFFPDMNGGSVEGRLFALKETNTELLTESLRQASLRGKKLYFYQDIFDTTLNKPLSEIIGEFRKSFVVIQKIALTDSESMFEVVPLKGEKG